MKAQRLFHANIWLTLLTFCLVALFVRLGIWQLDRAAEKQQILSAHEQRNSAPRVVLDGKNLEQIESYQKVSVTGHADAGHQILLDNKVHNGRVGFEVLVPVRISDSDKWILVNRGWIAMGANRYELPDIGMNSKIETFNGVIKVPLGDEFTIGNGNQWGSKWPQLIQWLDIKEAGDNLHYDLVPYLLLQSEEDSGAYVRDWKMVSSSPDKSISYAVQWFSFAIILLGLFLFLNYKRVPPGEV